MEKMSIRNFFILIPLFLLLTALILFPRAVEVINQNPIFGFDQGREYLAAQKIVENHDFILIGTELGAGSAGINGIFHGPVYYYFLTIPYIIFNGDPAGGTILIFLFSIISVVFLFYFVRRLFGFWAALLSTFLMAISPIFISQARFLWSPNPTTLFILLSFYFIYLFSTKELEASKTIKKTRNNTFKIGYSYFMKPFKTELNLYIFLSAFFSAFVYNFEMGIAVPLCVSLTIYSCILFKKNITAFLYLFLGFLLGFLPMVIFESRHSFMGLRGLLNYVFIHKNVQLAGSGQNFLLDHFNAIIANFNDTFGLSNNLPQPFFLVPTIIFLMFIAFYFKIEKKTWIRFMIFYFSILIAVTFLVFSQLKNALYSYYLTDLSLVYLIGIAYIAYASYQNKNKFVLYFLVLLSAILVIYSIPLQLKTTLYDLNDYGGTAKVKGKLDAIDFIYKDADSKPFGLLVFSPPIYTYPYDYLINWYGRRKYDYVPYKDKKGTFYLLIDKDPDKPWSYKGWLETVIKTGRIEFTKTLPSGFIVQKRVI